MTLAITTFITLIPLIAHLKAARITKNIVLAVGGIFVPQDGFVSVINSLINCLLSSFSMVKLFQKLTKQQGEWKKVFNGFSKIKGAKIEIKAPL